jgi:hypothetical protein
MLVENRIAMRGCRMRFLRLAFSSACALSLGLAGCGGGSSSNNGSDTDSQTAASSVSSGTAVDSAAALTKGATALAARSESAQATGTETWTWCAGEGGLCNVPGTRLVRYGVDGAYFYKTVSNAVGCGNADWGDPAFLRGKHCDYADSGATAPTSGSGWSYLVNEGQVFAVAGTATVRYGLGGTWVERSVSGSGECSNTFFGSDPVPYQVKHCELQGGAAPSSGTWTFVANEYEAFSFAGTRTVRYGTGSSWVQRSVSGGGTCSNGFFGTDPAPNQLKRCEADGAAAAAPAPAPAPAPSPAPAPAPSPPAVSGPGPLDVSSPASVIGTGAAWTCNENDLRAAVARGGVITFNCGGGTTTIALSATLVAPTDRDTVIDGGGRIVLDGQDRTQILRSFLGNFRTNDRVLAVQRLTMTRGRDWGTNYVGRNGNSVCAWGFKEGGGGAIYTRDVNLRVWGVTFDNNHGPQVGPDVAGGAIYVFGAKSLTVNNSAFRNNTASNGGAIGVLHVGTQLHNTTFDNNRATGQLANFGGASGCPVFNHAEQGGAGGLGGAFYSDGFNTDDLLSNVRMSDNASNDLGGAVFRSAYWGMGYGKQYITWENSRFERNRSPVGGGGAAYVNNALFTVSNTVFDGNDAGAGDSGALKITGATVQIYDVTVSNNRAVWAGGIGHWGGGPEGVGWSTRVNFSNNTPNDFAGVFPR